MENNTQKDKQHEPIFYRLDTSKPHAAERATSVVGAIIFVALSSLFLLIDIIVVAFDPLVLVSNAAAGPILMAVFSLGFLTFGIFYYKRQVSMTAAEAELFADCLLTDGKIDSVDFQVLSTKDSTRYHVSLNYSFFDKAKKRTAFFSETYSRRPNFFVGQNIMVAFNEQNSLILKKYSVSVEDEQKLHKAQLLRTLDDFDGLNGKSLNIDRSAPIQNAERQVLFLVLSGALLLFAVLFAFLIPKIVGIDFETRFEFDWIIWIMVFTLPTALLCVSVVFFVRSLKIRRRFLMVLNDPNCKFTFANIFLSEKTYSEQTTESVSICFIDDFGEKRHIESNSKVLCEKAKYGKIKLVVAYTHEDIAVISNCKTFE